MLPGFLNPAAYLKGGAKMLEEISKPTSTARAPAPKPRKPQGHRKIAIKTPSGRRSELELDQEVATNKELLDLRHDQKVALRHVEGRLAESEERVDQLLAALQTKQVEQEKGGLFSSLRGGEGNSTGAPPTWVSMLPVAAVIADDLVESPGALTLGLGGLGIIRYLDGSPLSGADLLAFGLAGTVAFRKWQDAQRSPSVAASTPA